MTVKSQGVTAAARRLKISQPSLSSQLKVLEGALNTKLFHRVGRRNELTREGMVIYGYCRQMFEVSEEMHEAVSEEIPYASRRLVIGVSLEIANSFVAEVVSLFLKKFSELTRPTVTIISGSHDRLVNQLRFREIDAVVTQVAMTISELENLKKAEIPVNLIYSKKQKAVIGRNSNIVGIIKTLSEDQEPRWVLPPFGFRLRTEINRFFEDNSLKGQITVESEVTESLIRSVVDGVGVALMPMVYVPKEIASKSLQKAGPKSGYWKHRIWLASHSSNKDSHLINSLSEAFTAACKALTS